MHEPPPLEYRSATRRVSPSVGRVRPRLWLSHMRTAAFLCVVALFVDNELRFDAGEARGVARIEAALAVYGGTCAAASVVLGALTRRDRFAIACCLLLFGLTAYVGVIMSRVIHN